MSLQKKVNKVNDWLPIKLIAKIEILEVSKIFRRFTFGAFWLLCGTVFLRGSNLCAGVGVARLLGKEIFGQYGVIQNSMFMFSAIGGLGLGITATRFIAKYRTHNLQRTAQVMFFCSFLAFISGLVMATAMIFAAPYLSGKILPAPELTNAFQLGALFLFFALWQGVQEGALVGLQEFKTLASVNFLSGAVLLFSTIGGASYFGLIGAVGGWVCANAIQCLINTITLRRINKSLGIDIKFSIKTEDFKMLWNFSIPAALGGILFSMTIWVGNAILVNTDNGFIEMGKYNAGYHWFAVLLFLPGIISNALFPMLAESNDYPAIRRMFGFGIKVSLVILCPLTFLVICMSPVIMGMYGQEFQKDWIVLSILACAALMAGIQGLISNTIAVMNKMWLHFQMNLFWAGIFILCGWAFVGWGMGAYGLALATLCSYFARLLWALIVVRRWFQLVT